MLPLDAWLSDPPWLESLPWCTASSVISQAMWPPVAPHAGHAAASVGNAFMTDEPARCESRPRTAQPDDVFDIWLQHKLHSLFATVAEEPIPAELLRILEEAPQADGTEDPKRP